MKGIKTLQKEPPRPNVFSYAVYEKSEWNDVHEYLIFIRSKKTYLYASEYCAGKYVLDFGCGSGYGAAVLAGRAREIVGVDVDEVNIKYCLYAYNIPNLTFLKVTAGEPVPFGDSTFDVVVSFQVIEHVSGVREYLYELRRVLKDDGVLFIATPNRRHRLLPFQKPWNSEHIREYSRDGLKRELAAVFEKVEIKGICGNDEMNKLEYERTKQDPVAFYLTRPVKTFLGGVLPARPLSVLKRLKGKFRPLKKRVGLIPPVSTARRSPRAYTVDDITIGDNTKTCLDLFAVCTKG